MNIWVVSSLEMFCIDILHSCACLSVLDGYLGLRVLGHVVCMCLASFLSAYISIIPSSELGCFEWYLLIKNYFPCIVITSKDPAKQNAAGLRAGPCGHCCCCCITSVVSDSVRPHRRQPTRLPRPWHSPGKNAGVGCHFLLECMRIRSESEVSQSCLTLSDPMDCSPPGSSVHGTSQARNITAVIL